jgi:integrase
MMVMSGVDLATVKEILGHSSIEMTMRYAHPTSEGKLNAVKALEKQMKDLDGLNTGSTVKEVSMPKVVSDSNNKC